MYKHSTTHGRQVNNMHNLVLRRDCGAIVTQTLQSVAHIPPTARRPDCHTGGDRPKRDACKRHDTAILMALSPKPVQKLACALGKHDMRPAPSSAHIQRCDMCVS